jgi:hypothetical protein
MALGNAITARMDFEPLMASHWSRWKVVYLYGLFLLISTFGDNIKIGPEVRLYELLVCRRYFLEHDPSKIDKDGNVEEGYCKLDVIQGELSVLRGWVFSWFLLVGTLVTIPYGVVADSIGRKIVVAASLISVTLPKAWIIVVCRPRRIRRMILYDGFEYLTRGYQAPFGKHFSQVRYCFR